jgi:ribosomal protein S18 acetylase RimI-like enzyme
MPIRLATESDAEAISALNRAIQQLHADALPQLFKPPSDATFPPEEVRGLLRSPHQRVYLALAEEPTGAVPVGSVAGGSVAVGYASVQICRQGGSAMRHAQDYLYIHHIAVAPARQRQGHGGRLLEAVRELARQENIAVVELDMWAFNAQAKAFFLKHGFAPLEERLALQVK